MTKSGDSDLVLEERVEAPKFLGLTLGAPKKGYTARISLDEGKKEVNYQEIEAQSKSVGVIPSGKGGFGLKPFDTKTLGKAQDNPLADRMRGSIRQVAKSAGWRLSYATWPNQHLLKDAAKELLLYAQRDTRKSTDQKYRCLKSCDLDHRVYQHLSANSTFGAFFLWCNAGRPRLRSPK